MPGILRMPIRSAQSYQKNVHLWRVLAPQYASAYRRASVEDHLCTTSFAAFSMGSVIPWSMPAEFRQQAFSVGSGIAALTNIAVINDAVPREPMNELPANDHPRTGIATA